MLRLQLGRHASGSLCAALVALLCVLPLRAFAQDAVDADLYSSDELVWRSLSDNPTLTALYEEWCGATARADAARSATPQPRLSYTAYLLAVETRQGSQRHALMLSQAIPRRRALRANAAAERTQSAVFAARFDAHALQLEYEIRVRVVRLAESDALIQLLQQQRDIYGDVLHHLAAILPTGGAEHGDVLRTTLMVEVLSDRLATLHAGRALTMRSLAGLVRIPHEERFDVNVPPLPTAAPALPSAESLVQRAADRSPMVAEHLMAAESAAVRAEAERLAVLPMPSVSAGWASIGRYDTPLPGTGQGGRDVFSIGLSMPLPVFRQQFRAAESAQLHVAEAATQRAEAVRWQLQVGIDEAIVLIADAGRRLDAYAAAVLPTAADAADHYAIQMGHGHSNHTAYLLAVEQQLQLEQAVVAARTQIALQLERIGLLTAATLGDQTPTIESFEATP